MPAVDKSAYRSFTRYRNGLGQTWQIYATPNHHCFQPGDEVSITRREMLPSAPDGIKTPMTTIRFPKAKTLQILTLLISIGVVQTSPMPHEPHNLTWVITNTATGTVINSTSHLAPIGTWFPDLVFDLCALADGTWDPWALYGGVNIQLNTVNFGEPPSMSALERGGLHSRRLPVEDQSHTSVHIGVVSRLGPSPGRHR